VPFSIGGLNDREECSMQFILAYANRAKVQKNNTEKRKE